MSIFQKIKENWLETGKISFSMLDFTRTVCTLTIATWVSRILLNFTGIENNSALIYVFAILIISYLTTGYFWGICASVVAAFLLNYYFMRPYAAFELFRKGYPVALLSMLAAAIFTGALTAKIKQQTKEAEQRERKTRELLELNQRLEAERTAIQVEAEKEKMRGNLLRAVSHDLRTPLTTISGATSVILENDENMSPEERQSLLRDIKEDSDWLIGMVENLLSVTRIRSEQTKLNTQEEIVDEVVGNAIQKIRKRFPDTRVTVQLPEEIILVDMDSILIEQAIINLLENAIRHSGDIEHITLRVYREQESVIFEISDRGKGLEQSKKDAENGDSSRGLGIGLSVCQSIVKAHNGRLESFDNPLGGTIFQIILPGIKEED